MRFEKLGQGLSFRWIEEGVDRAPFGEMQDLLREDRKREATVR